MGATAQRFPIVGEVFGGRFHIERELGGGTTSRLFVARDASTGGRCGLKIVLPHVTSAPHELIQRFNREAQALSLIDSPHCIQLLDYGHVGGGPLYLAVEWIEGPSLADEIARGPLPVARTVLILRQVLEALSALHSAGIIHRDIKPSHIMLGRQAGRHDHVKLLDFAIAKSWTHTSAGEPLLGDLTGKGRLMGTPRYMSPEQVVGRRVVPQSDLYSLGLVVVEMLTGEHANPGDDAVKVIQRHLSDDPFDIPPGLPGPLGDALTAMLSKRQEERPPNAAAVLHQIDPVVQQIEATANDETIPLGDLVNAAQKTDPDVPVLAPPGEEPTLPTDAIAAIREQAVSEDETVKFDNSQMAAPAPAPVPAPTAASAPVVPAPASGPPFAVDAPPSQPMLDASETGRISVATGQDRLELVFPAKVQTKHLFQMGGTAILTFVLSVLVTPWLAPIGLAIVAVIWMSTRVTSTLVFDNDRWKLTERLFRWSRSQDGPILGVHTLARAGEEITLTTDEGTLIVAKGFSDAEGLATCQQANEWLKSRVKVNRI